MSDFAESLVAQADAKRKELEELHREREAIEVRLDAAVRYLEKLNPLLVMEGAQPVNIKAATGQATGFAMPGNRSSKMPKRRPEFENLALARVVERVLAPGNPMHADQVVSEIYEITTKAEFRRAKHSLVGTLSTLAKNGGPCMRVPERKNTFQLRAALTGKREQGVLETVRT